MGFFSDLKEDLSQAVNELMPEEDLNQGDVAETKEQPVKNMPETTEKVQTEQPTDATKDNAALEEMLKNLDSIEIPQANAEEKPVEGSRRDTGTVCGRSSAGSGSCASERYDRRKCSGTGT